MEKAVQSYENAGHCEFYINASFDYEAWLGLGNKTRMISFYGLLQ